jgi:lipopolysaccharide transport system ATP-binding protein
MQDVVLSSKEISVRYRLRHSLFRHSYYDALKSISFDLYRGETLGIIGRNGAGKSTLLRVLSGICRPDVGMLINNGVKVSLLTLQLGFDPELSGKDNAILSGMLLGYRKHDVKRKLDEILEFSELGEFIEQPIKTYSNGMRARLGFSVAITMKPDVMLIDEVLGVGDAGFRKKAENVMKDRLRGEQTVVFVSHAAGQVRNLCDRVLWIENGKVKGIGETKKIMDEYEK